MVSLTCVFLYTICIFVEVLLICLLVLLFLSCWHFFLMSAPITFCTWALLITECTCYWTIAWMTSWLILLESIALICFFKESSSDLLPRVRGGETWVPESWN